MNDLKEQQMISAYFQGRTAFHENGEPLIIPRHLLNDADLKDAYRAGFARARIDGRKSELYRARYDMDPRHATVRFIDSDGEVTLIGYLVLPGRMAPADYWKNKAARAAIANLAG